MSRLQALADPEWVTGSLQRFGITTARAYGIRVPHLRTLAKELGRDHPLALQLWATGVHEARILATMIAVPSQLTEEQAEVWVCDLDSWDVCDQLCGNLLNKTPFAYRKAEEWSRREEEFVKRAGFALMAYLAVHDKKAEDSALLAFLPAIEHGASDNRNFVKKAVSWALREIGGRNRALNSAAIETAEAVAAQGTKSARWVSSDAMRELRSESVQRRLRA